MASHASIGEKTRLTNWVLPACQADQAGRQTSHRQITGGTWLLMSTVLISPT